MIQRIGDKYTIKGYLGAGAWKMAYRAASTDRQQDVAVIVFKDKNASVEETIREASTLSNLTRSNHEYVNYIADFYGFDYDSNLQSVFFVEELLLNPLDGVAPVQNMHRFVQYACDLCRGVTFIHENQRIHRDLKLDNCGLSYSGRVKIFDLGSVTSENSQVQGTILTRAPELLDCGSDLTANSMSTATTKADIWALGATLFALRTGRYPFVSEDQIQARRKINDDVKAKIQKLKTKEKQYQVIKDGEQKKRTIDQSITRLALSAAGQRQFREELEKYFFGQARDIIMSMLSMNPDQRGSARSYIRRWEAMLEGMSPRVQGEIPGSYDDRAIIHLQKFTERLRTLELTVTPNQRQRLIEEIKNQISKNIDNSERVNILESCLKDIS